MDALIRKLVKLGAVTIQREYGFWRVGCVVHNPKYSENNYIEVAGDKLYFALKELLKKSGDEQMRMLTHPEVSQGELY